MKISYSLIFAALGLKSSLVIFLLLVIRQAAIQAEVAISGVPFMDNGRKKRQTTDQRNKIEEILDREFCGSIQNFLTGNTCRIQSIQYKDNGSGGILVNFLIIIGPFAALLSTIVAQLKSTNDGLDMIEGFQFVPGVISGKSLSVICMLTFDFRFALILILLAKVSIFKNFMRIEQKLWIFY